LGFYAPKELENEEGVLPIDRLKEKKSSSKPIVFRVHEVGSFAIFIGIQT
jgi:hypothetical protein